MKSNLVIQWEDMQQTLMMAKRIFDRVRLVDPDRMCEVTLAEDGTLIEEEGKTEHLDENACQVVSNMVAISDKSSQERELILELISKTQGEKKERESLSEYDGLTGLYNKAKFFKQIKKRIKQEDDGKRYAFIRVDLDRFRLYNTFFGEAEGDRLLVYLADKIRESASVFEDAEIGRIESDIFGIFCRYDEQHIVLLRDRLIDDLKQYNDTYYIEPSIGVYILEDKELPVKEMYARASLAVEACKNKFMASIGYYNENMTDKLMVEQELMNEAQKALEEEQFVVYLQPKTNIHTEKPYGAEALVRWRHPDKGLVSPGKFIPVFESNGFIGRLDYYMWEHTCMLLRRWIDEGLDPAPVSVNVSRANMYNPNLVENVKGLVEKYQISPELLQLELTESAFMDDPEMMINKVKQLQKYGFTVLMDDFGSGYSSLNTLKDIPVDILKVDMKFLGTGAGNGRSERILASVVRMAAWLDLAVIVEGVETKEQRNFLESIGCEYAQGFYYAKPMPWQEYENTLRNPAFYEKIDEERLEKYSLLEKVWNVNPEMEKTFNTIMQPAAVYQYTENGIMLLQINAEFNQSFGYTVTAKKQFENNSQYIPDDYIKKIRGAFAKCVRKKKTAHCDYMRMYESGENRWYRMRLHYITEEENCSIIMVLFYDVSQEKEMEQEIKKYKLTTEKQNRVRLKMLLVDDEKMTRILAREFFKEQFDVLEAANGKEALDILKEEYETISVILLDMNMPVMNGEEFLQYKNASKKYADIPVVIISADDRPVRQIEMLKNGVNDYVTKPLIPEVVECRVQNVLEYNSRFRSLMKEYRKKR